LVDISSFASMPGIKDEDMDSSSSSAGRRVFSVDLDPA
jgi:hypothetical protein